MIAPVDCDRVGLSCRSGKIHEGWEVRVMKLCLIKTYYRRADDLMSAK